MKNKYLYLVDGSGYIFRAYHAMPALTRKSDGLPVGAVAGFCNMLYKLLCDINATSLNEKPTHLAIILDHSSCGFRKAIYPAYKANRPTPPEDLIVQFKLIRQAVEAFNVVMIEQPAIEADDIIATYAKQAEKDGAKVNIISSDKDLMQLITQNIAMYDPSKNKVINKQEVIEKFSVTPEQMIDFQSLVGDSSDNIPGVKGIGPKCAAKLLEEYGSLDNIYTNLDNMKAGSIKDKLINSKENAEISRKLATLKTDVDLPIKWEEFVLTDWCDSKLLSFLKALDLNKLLNRIANANDIDASNIETTKLNVNWQESDIIEPLFQKKDTENITISTIEEFNKLYENILDKNIFSFYLNEQELNIAFSETQNYVINLSLLDIEKIKRLFCDEAILIISYDIKAQLKILDSNINSYHDVMLMAYVLNNETKLDLTNLLKTYLNVTEINAVNILNLYEHLHTELIKSQQYSVYEFLERPMVRILYDMEKMGIKINTNLLDKLSYEFAKELSILEADIFAIAEEEFNLGSPKQIGYILFDKLKLNSGKKTKTGQFSTNVLVLEELAREGAEIAQKMLRWRQLSKLKNTYTDSLPKYADENSRVHTNYLLAATNTARLASSEPNLQNIPARGLEGKKIREAFISEENKLLLCADYNQIELRILTHIAKVKSLQEAFKKSRDIHATTASKIFDIPVDGITTELRQKAKAINFGIIYGMSAFGLSQQLQISTSEAQKYIDAYLNEFKEIKNYIEDTKEFVLQHGYVETIFGRKIYFKNLATAKGPLRATLERAAINARIQGSAADAIRKAMYNVKNDIKSQNINLKMLMQVHDELVFEVDKNISEEAKKLIIKNMENITLPHEELSVKLKVMVGEATNWAEAH